MQHEVYTYCIDGNENKCVWVRISMEYNGIDVSIENIQVEGKGKQEAGFIGKTIIGNKVNRSCFYNQYEENGQIVEVALENEHANFILQQVLKIKERSKPMFGG